MKYPIYQHILFEEKRETYARKFHALAEVLKKHDVDVSLLHDVIDASHDVEDLAADIAFMTGYKKGWHNGQANRHYETFREHLNKEKRVVQ
ncbi:hypothetical protein J2S78_000528 [Salibacterium salarium]|uniref:Uncharacterized protein n=1 Tax=Salibacterium salarium TaxID=284579 RepID=A0A3R9QP67_9BACI|nr:hypothetical protein [Salibacterium salarium]MDQ0298120.1 hypothetical protein [Salibacterium salarium]RSL35215.1 hypothetical protein D7Z54_01175 [Salibacterium salarium]